MPSITDFQRSLYELKQQGSNVQPKTVPLIVIGWQPKGKGEPLLSAAQLQSLFFGPTDSVAHWFEQNSQGRFRLVPHPTHPVIGPLESVYEWPFYWRNDPKYVRQVLCGHRDIFCEAWEQNPYKVPPPVGDPHRYQDSNGEIYYLDDLGFIGGHSHSWAEAVRAAAKLIDFSEFDRDGDGDLSPDECLVVIVKAQANTFGTRRPVSGSDVPKTALKVNGVTIKTICELYAAPPHEPNDLAAAVEEVLHLAANLADQYPDRSELQPRGNYRQIDDPGRPGQLALTDACGQPVHIDPYHKLKWGWLNPQLADHSGRYTLHAAATTGDALILYSPYFGVEEFFILENRWRGSSYDRFRDNNREEGLALWHCIQDPQLSSDWARRAVHLRRADPALDIDPNAFTNHRVGACIRRSLPLFDGNDPARGYDLHDDSQPQHLRFRNGLPSRLRLRNISPAGPAMTVDVEVPPPAGQIVAVQGRIKLLRVHAHGTGYGPPAYRLHGDCVVKLDSEPGTVLGLDLSGANAPAAKGMLDLLRVAFQNRTLVKLEYQAVNALGGQVIRVIHMG